MSYDYIMKNELDQLLQNTSDALNRTEKELRNLRKAGEDTKELENVRRRLYDVLDLLVD